MENKYFLPYHIQNDIIHNQIYKKNIHFMLNKFRPIKFWLKFVFPSPQVKWGFIHTKMTTSIQAMLAKVNSEKLIGGSLKEVPTFFGSLLTYSWCVLAYDKSRNKLPWNSTLVFLCSLQPVDNLSHGLLVNNNFHIKNVLTENSNWMYNVSLHEFVD